MGSQLDVLLERRDFSQFSDRLTFMGAIAESDADVAATADAAGQEAEWAAQDYEARPRGRRVRSRRGGASDRRAPSAVRRTEAAGGRAGDEEYDRWVAAQAAAAEAAAVETMHDGGAWRPDDYDPPAVSGAAGDRGERGLRRAGVPVRLRRRRPQHVRLLGAHVVGVGAGRQSSIPHSAAAQYARFPRSRSPTCSPATSSTTGTTAPTSRSTSAAARIIHARNPTPSGDVQVDSMYGYDRPWGAVRVA